MPLFFYILISLIVRELFIKSAVEEVFSREASEGVSRSPAIRVTTELVITFSWPIIVICILYNELTH